MAYRHLAGLGLDRDEERAVLALWKEAFYLGPEPEAIRDLKVWVEARSKIRGSDPAPYADPFRPLGQDSPFTHYLNCSGDAFRTAVRTLNERAQRFGATSPEVEAWVEAQDQVFYNCGGGESIPSPPRPGSPPLLRADRAYQIAAAHFYAGHLDEAEKLFRDIASDRSSPWRQVAPYLVARTLVRKATLGAGPNQTDEAGLARAEDRLQQVLRDDELRPMHAAAKRLLAFVHFRLRPEERLGELDPVLLQRHIGAALKLDLRDYLLLLGGPAGRASADGAKAGHLTEWLLTFMDTDSAALATSLKRWTETSSFPWLVAALAKVPAGHPRMAELLEAAAKVGRNSPAYPTLAFHAIRLMIESGKKDEAHAKLDALLAPGGPSLPLSSRNLLLAQRMALARDLEDFLKHAPRAPAGLTLDVEFEEIPTDFVKELDAGTKIIPKGFGRSRARLDADAATILNARMPLPMLADVVASTTLPNDLRRDLALAGWTRVVLLDDESAAVRFGDALQGLWPQVGGGLAAAYRSGGGNAGNKAVAVYLMLKTPGARPYVKGGLGRLTAAQQIDNFRDNWWCALTPPSAKNGKGPLDFLSEADRAKAKDEVARLAGLPVGANYLAAQAIEWAKRSPKDPRVPEALHLAVRATRYGCTDGDTGKFSRQALQLLHRRYPKSEWAKKTKYWFGER